MCLGYEIIKENNNLFSIQCDPDSYNTLKTQLIEWMLSDIKWKNMTELYSHCELGDKQM